MIKIESFKSFDKMKKHLIVLIPLGIPSHLQDNYIFNLQQQGGDNFFVFSKQKIRQSIIATILESQPEIEEDDLLNQSAKLAKKEYWRQINSMNQMIMNEDEDQKSDKCILYLKKDHSPLEIKSVINKLNSIFSNIQMKIIAIYPQCLNTYEFQPKNSSRKFYYPFSLSFILNCLQRVINRKDQKTSYSPPIEYLLSGIIQKFQKFRKVKFNLKSFQLNRIDCGIPLQTNPLLNKTDKALSEEFILINNLQKALSQLTNENSEKNTQLIQKVINSLHQLKSKQFISDKILQDVNIKKFFQEVKKPVVKIIPLNRVLFEEQKYQIDPQIESIMTNEKQLPTKKLLICIPMGITGMGKSYMTQFIEKSNNVQTFRVLSSDKIRRQLMSELKKKNSRLSQEELFQRTRKAYTGEWRKQLKNLFQDHNALLEGNNVVFLDKNHPPKDISRIIRSLPTRRLANDVEYQITAVIPKCLNTYEFQPKNSSRKFYYPFSLSFILNCLQRVINRKDHYTMIGTDRKLLSVTFLFINFMRGFKYKNLTEERFGLDSLFEIPFTNEYDITNQKFPKKLVQTLNKVLCCKLLDKQHFDLNELQKYVSFVEFCELLTASNLKFEEVKPEILQQDVQITLQQLFNQFYSTDKQMKNIKQIPDRKMKKRKRKNIPLYVGVQVQNTNASHVIKNYIDKIENTLNQKGHAQKGIFESMKFNDEFHVTCLFLGGKKNHPNIEQLEYYQEDQKMPIKIHAIVYVSNKIMCGVCYQNDFPKGLYICNKFPHLTIMTGEWKPFASNKTCEALFNKGRPFQQLYETEQLKKQDSYVFVQKDILINKQKVTAYVVKVDGGLTFKGKLKFY